MTDPSNSLPAVLVSLKGDPSRHRRFKPGQPLTADTVLRSARQVAYGIPDA